MNGIHLEEINSKDNLFVSKKIWFQNLFIVNQFIDCFEKFFSQFDFFKNSEKSTTLIEKMKISLASTTIMYKSQYMKR